MVRSASASLAKFFQVWWPILTVLLAGISYLGHMALAAEVESSVKPIERRMAKLEILRDEERLERIEMKAKLDVINNQLISIAWWIHAPVMQVSSPTPTVKQEKK